VSPRVGADTTLRPALDLTVADRCRRIESVGDVRLGEPREVTGGGSVVGPHAGVAVGLELDPHGCALRPLIIRAATEHAQRVLHVVSVLVGEHVGLGERTAALLFAVSRYEQVMDAYLRGLEARARASEPLGEIASVASFFLSRIDTKVDAQLPEDSPVRGRVAIANAQVAYQRYLAKFSGPSWERLRRLGARTQRPLWASTGIKDPHYPDVLYVTELVGPDVVNTMPEKTLRAFADHGEARRTVDAHRSAAEDVLAAARDAGVDLDHITGELEREGVRSFCDSYHQLLGCLQSKLTGMAHEDLDAERWVDEGGSPAATR